MEVEGTKKNRNVTSDSDKAKENDENNEAKETTNDDKPRTCDTLGISSVKNFLFSLVRTHFNSYYSGKGREEETQTFR